MGLLRKDLLQILVKPCAAFLEKLRSDEDEVEDRLRHLAEDLRQMNGGHDGSVTPLDGERKRLRCGGFRFLQVYVRDACNQVLAEVLARCTIHRSNGVGILLEIFGPPFV